MGMHIIFSPVMGFAKLMPMPIFNLIFWLGYTTSEYAVFNDTCKASDNMRTFVLIIFVRRELLPFLNILDGGIPRGIAGDICREVQ